MAAGHHGGTDLRRNGVSARVGQTPIRDDPFLDLGAREQKLAGDAAHRERPVGRQFIDLSLLDAEHRGQFPGREEFCLGHLLFPNIS